MTTNSAVPDAIQTLVEIFDADLPDVAFPGVDAARLRELAEHVEQSAAALEDAEQAANAARRAHADARSALVHAAERGAGYARVYASDDEALRAKLADVPLGDRPKRAKTPARRGRKAPPKPESGRRNGSVAELPFAGRKGKAGAA
ncbi:MAG: hypothetical protein AAF721_16200 [Myxococcota bacterium]